MAKRKKATLRPALHSQDTLFSVEYEITSGPIQYRRYKRLPNQVKDAIERLHDEAQRHPRRRAIPELVNL